MDVSQVIIYGASDDLIEVEGDLPGCDEYNAESGEFVLSGPAGGLRVSIDYTQHGTWRIGVEPFDEDTPMLLIAIDQHPRHDGQVPGYSARATVEGVTSIVDESPVEP